MKLKDVLAEVAPPGFEKAVKAMKKKKSVDNPYAVAWSMKNKGDEPSDDDVDEMDASQPNAPSSMAGMDEICEECGMSEGQHMPGCSRMNEFSNDMIGGEGMGLDETEQEDTTCPECGAPHGMKHDKGCPIGRDEEEPEHMGLDRRERYYETTDYDGLPLNESNMFDRFDTLVGHRFDGTFDARETEATKLRALVKKVVREAWMTRDPDTGEETEHSMDDKDIEDLYVDKDKKHEARGCVREGDIEEMKLSVAGPAFGAASSDTDDQDDDGDEDYKVLTPKKAPEPDQSGTRLKSKDKKSKS
jgi:hypothetical protein